MLAPGLGGQELRCVPGRTAGGSALTHRCRRNHGSICHSEQLRCVPGSHTALWFPQGNAHCGTVVGLSNTMGEGLKAAPQEECQGGTMLRPSSHEASVSATMSPGPPEPWLQGKACCIDHLKPSRSALPGRRTFTPSHFSRAPVGGEASGHLWHGDGNFLQIRATAGANPPANKPSKSSLL